MKKNNPFYLASRNTVALLLGLVMLAACATQPTSANRSMGSGLTFATPESVGVDSDRLDRLTQAMQGFVDDGRLAGVVTAAARDGKIIHFESVGQRDIAAGSPMTDDALFRIYSMTKPITGVAMMMLYERGLFKLSDPVSMYIPEFADLQVYAGMDDDGNMLTEAPAHPMTVRELMNHTGGLTYGLFSQSPVDDLYNAAGVLDPTSNLQGMIDKLAKIPLRQQPGSLWHYSVSVDVQGYMVEKLSGQRFSDFLEDNIFEPLGMVDTDFFVPAEKADRLAEVYAYGPDGKLFASEGFTDGPSYLVEHNFEGGGGGLVGSTMDYLRFSQMLLNGGELDGARILAPLTIELMHRNQLPKGLGDSILGANGTTFGLDFAIIEDPVEAEGYSKGEYYWGGAAGTWFWVDPVENIVFVGMIQQFGNGIPDVRGTSRRLLYQAIMEPYGI